MNKKFKTYLILWAILFVMYSVIYFALPSAMGTGRIATHIITFIIVIIAMIGQLICAYFAFKADSLQKLFYNISLVTVSYTGLMLLMIFGIVTVICPNIPPWVIIVVCVAIIGFTAIAVGTASAAATVVSNIDEKIKVKTDFIKSLRMDAEVLMNQAENENIKSECKKVYEAVRYSDPMSHEALSGLENEITLEFAELKEAVVAGDEEKVKTAAKAVLILVDEWNKKCKIIK